MPGYILGTDQDDPSGGSRRITKPVPRVVFHGGSRRSVGRIKTDQVLACGVKVICLAIFWGRIKTIRRADQDLNTASARMFAWLYA